MTSSGDKDRLKIRPTLTHAGIWVWNLKKMQNFYTRVLGLSASDQGYVKRYKGHITFMSSDPKVHHQIILCEGRPEHAPSTINQLSFTVGSLDELKEMNRRVAAERIEIFPRNHGNAWSIYFDDPEGNNIEVYLDSPFHVPQPFGEPLDLSMSNEDILRATEELIRNHEGFMTREEWAAKRAEQLR